MTTLPLTAIRIDGGTQPRESLNWPVIEEYAEALRTGEALPPVTVFYDGSDYWLADGFHRWYAAANADLQELAADVRQGTRRDAVLFSVAANSAHGLRRSNEDKRRAIMTLLQDDEWGTWSDREIAKRCRVDHKTVGAVRAAMTGEIPSERTYTTRHGTIATMQTANIGVSNREPLTPEEQIELSKHEAAIERALAEFRELVRSVVVLAKALQKHDAESWGQADREELDEMAAFLESIEYGATFEHMSKIERISKRILHWHRAGRLTIPEAITEGMATLERLQKDAEVWAPAARQELDEMYAFLESIEGSCSPEHIPRLVESIERSRYLANKYAEFNLRHARALGTVLPFLTSE